MPSRAQIEERRKEATEAFRFGLYAIAVAAVPVAVAGLGDLIWGGSTWSHAFGIAEVASGVLGSLGGFLSFAAGKDAVSKKRLLERLSAGWTDYVPNDEFGPADPEDEFRVLVAINRLGDDAQVQFVLQEHIWDDEGGCWQALRSKYIPLDRVGYTGAAWCAANELGSAAVAEAWAELCLLTAEENKRTWREIRAGREEKELALQQERLEKQAQEEQQEERQAELRALLRPMKEMLG